MAEDILRRLAATLYGERSPAARLVSVLYTDFSQVLPGYCICLDWGEEELAEEIETLRNYLSPSGDSR
jgi:hypothetical protein